MRLEVGPQPCQQSSCSRARITGALGSSPPEVIKRFGGSLERSRRRTPRGRRSRSPRTLCPPETRRCGTVSAKNSSTISGRRRGGRPCRPRPDPASRHARRSRTRKSPPIGGARPRIRRGSSLGLNPGVAGATEHRSCERAQFRQRGQGAPSATEEIPAESQRFLSFATEFWTAFFVRGVSKHCRSGN
jgi:hypothetical protein